MALKKLDETLAGQFFAPSGRFQGEIIRTRLIDALSTKKTVGGAVCAVEFDIGGTYG